MNMNKSLSVMELNIHQQGGAGKGVIPPWVKEETSGFGIAVLTEVCTKCSCRSEFIGELEQLGYGCAASENRGGNDILIAVKSCFPICRSSWVPCYGNDSVPENLRVDIDCGGRLLTVLGVRIKDLHGNAQKRSDEFRLLLDWVKDTENPVLITGDFNNNRRGTSCEAWNLNVMEEMLSSKGFKLYTPEGGSIYQEGSPFPYDHFIAKGVEIDLQPYDRDFTRRDRAVYRWGRDFCSGYGAEKESVEPGFPDHAILKGTLRFPEDD